MEQRSVHGRIRANLPADFAAIACRLASATFDTKVVFNVEYQAIDLDGDLIPLAGLYDRIRPDDKSRWRSEVRRRLDEVATTKLQIATVKDEWASVKSGLRVCVRKQSALNQISQPITGDICFTLILDTRNFSVRVTAKDLRSWGVTQTEAWRIGLFNNKKFLTADRRHFDHNGSGIEVLTGDLCTSGVLTDLQHHYRLKPFPRRFLLALPTFETLILVPDYDREAQSLVQQVRTLLPIWLVNSEHPLSSDLYKLDIGNIPKISCFNDSLQG